jgi:hypothetical protein
MTGKEKWYLHKFRATYLTKLLRDHVNSQTGVKEPGLDLRTVRKMAGHKEITSTMRYVPGAVLRGVWINGKAWQGYAVGSGYAELALVAVAVGLHSVVSFNVAQRTNEFGIRMALERIADSNRALSSQPPRPASASA